MKVAVDTSPLISGHKTRGMGYYTRNLIDSLKKLEVIEILEFTNPNSIKGVDLVHYPYFDLFFLTLPIKKKFPSVVTVGDVTPLVFPSHYPPGVKGAIKNKIQHFSLKRANSIITFSQNSKKDINKYLGIPKEKIFPTPLAQSSNFKKITDQNKLNKVKQTYNLPDTFALFVGSVNWNKNLLNLTEACIRANIKLVLIGKGFEEKNNLTHKELESYLEFLQKYSKNPNILMLGYVDDEDIVAIYNLAKVLLFSSFYEGFGLPILEAQACGCPVITSNISSMPEVGGKGVLYVDPYSVENIVRGIERLQRVSKGEGYRLALIKRGFENAKRFSWEKCAKGTIKAYEYAIKR